MAKNTRREQGFALIDLVFVCGIIGILASIAMPRMLLARQSAGAASAIGSLRTINSGQLTFAITCGSGFYAPDLAWLATAPAGAREGFVGATLAGAPTVTRAGYVLNMQATSYSGAPPSCNGLSVGESGQGFKVTADPVEPTNTRFFGSNANLALFEDVSTMWTAMPEAGEPSSGRPVQ